MICCPWCSTLQAKAKAFLGKLGRFTHLPLLRRAVLEGEAVMDLASALVITVLLGILGPLGLGAIGDALDPEVLTSAMEKALARLTKRQRAHVERHAQVERELAQVQQRLDRLVHALADGTLPADEIKARLSTEKARKTALTADFTRFERLAKVVSLNVDQIAQKLRARVNDVAGVLGRQTPQARQMLRKILADRIELKPVGSGRQRGYKFRGSLSLEKLIAGEAMNNTSDYGGPNGIRTRV